MSYESTKTRSRSRHPCGSPPCFEEVGEVRVLLPNRLRCRLPLFFFRCGLLSFFVLLHEPTQRLHLGCSVHVVAKERNRAAHDRSSRRSAERSACAAEAEGLPLVLDRLEGELPTDDVTRCSRGRSTECADQPVAQRLPRCRLPRLELLQPIVGRTCLLGRDPAQLLELVEEGGVHQCAPITCAAAFASARALRAWSASIATGAASVPRPPSSALE